MISLEKSFIDMRVFGKAVGNVFACTWHGSGTGLHCRALHKENSRVGKLIGLRFQNVYFKVRPVIITCLKNVQF